MNTITEAIHELQQGHMILVVDDENRENEGDLIALAEKATPEVINFMITHGKGLVCVPMLENRLQELELPLMVERNTETHQTAFTLSVDSMDSTTGISAEERSETILQLIDPTKKAADFRRPGHIFPLMAKENGVLARPGHTEAAVDLARLAGSYPAGVICEVILENGQMARVPELKQIAKEHSLVMITIQDLIEYRLREETLVERVASAQLPTDYGDYRIIGYRNNLDSHEHVALLTDNLQSASAPLIRIHSECLTGDVFASQRCDCGPQLETSLHLLQEEGNGVLLYMRQEGRGIGLLNKLLAYQLQEQEGIDTVEANLRLGFDEDLRSYALSAQILKDLGIKQVRLLTNNPHKVTGLQKYGIEVVEVVPVESPANPHNERYLLTKREKMGHLLQR